jgi:hypothetical protein
MEGLCTVKILNKLDVIERKLDMVNEIYTKEYIIINRKFICDVILLGCIISIVVLTFFRFYGFI